MGLLAVSIILSLVACAVVFGCAVMLTLCNAATDACVCLVVHSDFLLRYMCK